MEWWGWAILGIACMVIEVHLTQDFTLFCVGVAAFVVTAVAAFAVDLPFWSHWLLFSALSVVVLLTVRKPLLGRLRPDRGRDADFDYLLGEVATPSEDLAGNGVGKAELRFGLDGAQRRTDESQQGPAMPCDADRGADSVDQGRIGENDGNRKHNRTRGSW